MGFVTPTFKVSIYATNMEDTQKQPNEPGKLIKVRQHYKSVRRGGAKTVIDLCYIKLSL